MKPTLFRTATGVDAMAAIGFFGIWVCGAGGCEGREEPLLLDR